MFFQDLLVGMGAMTVAFIAADALRHYFPNVIRFITAGLIVFTVDALVPGWSILHLPVVILGGAVTAAGGIWYLNKQRVVRQDGTIDHG
jgi:predicted membrane channel-forming protein YqfA (hemolysin III family)